MLPLIYINIFVIVLSFNNKTYLGHHQIHISYRKQKVPGSPFQVKSFDQKRVQVIGLKCGYIGRVNKFKGISSII